MKTLKDFVADHPGSKKGTPPWLPSLPEWLEVLQAYRDGVPLYQIRLWLISERGYPAVDVTRSRVAYLSRMYKDE